MVNNTKIIWSDRAKYDLKNIYEYYYDLSPLTAKSLIGGILKRIHLLKRGFVWIGQKEPLLTKTKFEYRYLIYRNYKIIYRTENKIIKIITIYDTRQNPTKLSNFTE